MPLPLIAGHSHVAALGVPLKSANGDCHTTSLSRSGASAAAFEGLTGPWPRRGEYWREVYALGKARTVALVWEGNQYHAFAMFEASPPIDFVLAEEPAIAVNEDACIVAELALRARLSKSLAGLHHVLGTMKKRGARTPVLVGTPPPIGDNDAIRGLLQRAPFFKKLAASTGLDIETAPLAPAMLRYKLWRLVQRMTREVGAAYGVPFHPVPRAVHDENGFLRSDLWQDASHANAHYGDLLLEDLAGALHLYDSNRAAS